jgi:hypothetical protein
MPLVSLLKQAGEHGVLPPFRFLKSKKAGGVRTPRSPARGYQQFLLLLPDGNRILITRTFSVISAGGFNIAVCCQPKYLYHG